MMLSKRLNQYGWDLKKALTTPVEDEPDTLRIKCVDHLGNKYRSITALSKAYGIPYATLQRRLRHGWDLEKALAVIPECETREIFNKRYCQAYRMVKAAGLLAEYYTEKVKPKRKWTLEACATAARYCETKAEFRKKYRRAYERLRREGLLDELFEDKMKQGGN